MAGMVSRSLRSELGKALDKTSRPFQWLIVRGQSGMKDEKDSMNAMLKM